MVLFPLYNSFPTLGEQGYANLVSSAVLQSSIHSSIYSLFIASFICSSDIEHVLATEDTKVKKSPRHLGSFLKLFCTKRI